MANSPPTRKTVGKVQPLKQKPAMTPLAPEDIKGDRSVEDFIKWIQNFGTQSGHFVSKGAAHDFARQVEKYIGLDGFIGVPPSDEEAGS
jgi:hypothetical protein